MGYRVLLGFIGVYKGLQGVTRGYRKFVRVASGYKGLQWVTGRYKGLHGVTRGYRGL